MVYETGVQKTDIQQLQAHYGDNSYRTVYKSPYHMTFKSTVTKQFILYHAAESTCIYNWDESKQALKLMYDK